MIYSINGTRQPDTWWLKNHPPRRDRFCLVEREGCIDRAWDAFTAAVSDYLGPNVRIRSAGSRSVHSVEVGPAESTAVGAIVSYPSFIR